MNLEKISMSAIVNQVINSQTEAVMQVINKNQTDLSVSQKASAIVDGLFSGSTFVYIAIVIGVVSVLGVIIKVLAGRSASG